MSGSPIILWASTVLCKCYCNGGLELFSFLGSSNDYSIPNMFDHWGQRVPRHDVGRKWSGFWKYLSQDHQLIHPLPSEWRHTRPTAAGDAAGGRRPRQSGAACWAGVELRRAAQLPARRCHLHRGDSDDLLGLFSTCCTETVHVCLSSQVGRAIRECLHKHSVNRVDCSKIWP